MSSIYELRSTDKAGETHFWGARRSLAQAQALLIESSTGANAAWAARYHIRWWIETIDSTGLFEIPPLPKPRDRFSVRSTPIASEAGRWNTLSVEVLNEDGNSVSRYERNYPNLYQTFEPFRQGDRLFALVSRDYTATSVLDLASGQIIAEESACANGFCPVGFYVPDWWDLHDGMALPGASDWRPEYETTKGDFGFVWGCHWGDDNSWKVQYLDLSKIQEGEILRDARFGYVPLASHEKLIAKDFIHCFFEGGQRKVRFSVLAEFDTDTGVRQVNEFE